jgi:hypothetical protein
VVIPAVAATAPVIKLRLSISTSTAPNGHAHARNAIMIFAIVDINPKNGCLVNRGTDKHLALQLRLGGHRRLHRWQFRLSGEPFPGSDRATEIYVESAGHS